MNVSGYHKINERERKKLIRNASFVLNSIEEANDWNDVLFSLLVQVQHLAELVRRKSNLES